MGAGAQGRGWDAHSVGSTVWSRSGWEVGAGCLRSLGNARRGQVGRSFPEGYSLGVAHGLHVSPSVFGGVSSGQSHLSSPETLLLFHWTRGGTYS